MNHKVKVHEFFGLMSDEVLAFIKESESGFPCYRRREKIKNPPVLKS